MRQLIRARAMAALAVMLCISFAPLAAAAAGSWIEPILGQATPDVGAIARDGDMTLLLAPNRARILLPKTTAVAVNEEPDPGLTQPPTCFGCQDLYFATTDEVRRYSFAHSDFFAAVIDTTSGALEFATFLDGGGKEEMLRGMQLVGPGKILLHGNSDADLNGSGFVGFEDVGILKAFFFGTPGPSGLLLP